MWIVPSIISRKSGNSGNRFSRQSQRFTLSRGCPNHPKGLRLMDGTFPARASSWVANDLGYEYRRKIQTCPRAGNGSGAVRWKRSLSFSRNAGACTPSADLHIGRRQSRGFLTACVKRRRDPAEVEPRRGAVVLRQRPALFLPRPFAGEGRGEGGAILGWSANTVPPTIMPVRTDRKRRNRPGHSAFRHVSAPAWRDTMGGTNSGGIMISPRLFGISGRRLSTAIRNDRTERRADAAACRPSRGDVDHEFNPCYEAAQNLPQSARQERPALSCLR
jgi:hypothetical protein